MSPPDPQSIRKLLIVRNDRIGDLILTLPAFEAARRALPGASITALVSPYTAPLLGCSPHVDEIVVDRPGQSGWALGRRLRQGRYDAAAAINTNTRNCIALWRARIPVRVTWSHRPVGLLLGNRHVRLHRSHPPIHESEFALAFLRELGLEADIADLHPRLEVDPDARAHMAERIRQDFSDLGAGDKGPLFGIAPGCGGSAFNWPLERYAKLAAELAGHGRVMVTGSPAERGMLAEMRGAMPESVRARAVFYTDLDLMELAAALAEADVFTASSTGPMHIAAVVGTPVVALFSPHPVHSPLKWGPLGERNTILVPPLGEGEAPCVPEESGTEVMCRIGVEDVVRANVGLLKKA